MPCKIACFVITVMHNFFCSCFITVVSAEKADRQPVIDSRHNHAAFRTIRAGLIIFVNNIEMIEGAGLAHRSRTGSVPDKIRTQNGSFRLAEAFHNSQSCGIFPAVHNFRLEGFTGRKRHSDVREIIF